MQFAFYSKQVWVHTYLVGWDNDITFKAPSAMSRTKWFEIHKANSVGNVLFCVLNNIFPGYPIT